MPNTQWLRTPILCVLMGTLALPARAQDSGVSTTAFQADPFEPLPGRGNTSLNVATTAVSPHLGLDVALFTYLVNGTLALREVDETGATSSDGVVENQLKAELSANLGLFEVAELGVVVPFVLYQDGAGSDVLGSGIGGFASGDVRLVPKLQLIQREESRGFGLAVMAPVHLPTGDEESFNSDGVARVEPRLVGDVAFGRLLFAFNLGYAIRPARTAINYRTDDTVRWGLGAQLPLGILDLTGFGNIYGAIPTVRELRRKDLNDTLDAIRPGPIEVLVGAQAPLPNNLSLSVAGGTGLTADVGSPVYRFVASLSSSWDFGAPRVATDALPPGAEVLLRAHETPPVSPHTPEPALPRDSDGDGIGDDLDACVDEPEDADGIADDDGCPEDDVDGDGVLDGDDLCLESAEDPDGFQDDDGCADDDNDGDGVVDLKDACPENAGAPSLDPAENGCPRATQTLATASADRIEITGQVLFGTGDAVIRSESFELLDQIAAVLANTSSIKRLRIEGHTDAAGAETTNLELSTRRARAVRDYLVSRGVVASRLHAEGFGESRPIASNRTQSGRAKNRRVEFLIEEQAQ